MDDRVYNGFAGETVVRPMPGGQSPRMARAVREAARLDGAARGFSVERWLTQGGVVETKDASKHTISILVSSPLRVDSVRDGRSYVALMKRGDIEIVPKGEIGRWVDKGPAELLVMRIDSGFLNKVASGMGYDPKTLEVLPRVQVRDAQLEHLAWALEAALAEGEADVTFVQSLGTAIAARLIKAHANVRQARVQRALSRKQTAEVCDYIEAHLSERLTLQRLAQVVGVSTSHFKGLFKAAVGLPAHRYVMRRRVARAVELIKAGSSSLSEIAAATGFAHQSHLARAMRAVVGRTPGELVREYR